MSGGLKAIPRFMNSSTWNTIYVWSQKQSLAFLIQEAVFLQNIRQKRSASNENEHQSEKAPRNESKNASKTMSVSDKWSKLDDHAKNEDKKFCLRLISSLPLPRKLKKKLFKNFSHGIFLFKNVEFCPIVHALMTRFNALYNMKSQFKEIVWKVN